MILTFQLISSLTINGCLEKESNKNSYKNTKSWTVMIYFCADTRSSYVTSDLNNSGNGLYIPMVGTLNSIQYNLTAESANDINIIAIFDEPWSQEYPNGRAKLYEITKDSMVMLDDLRETNMGDQQTLEDFITFCKTNYQASHYSLTLVNHGRGFAGCCYDYHAPHPSWFYALGDCLTVEELDTALANTGGVDVLFFDTCLGGSFEVAWQLVDEVDYIVAGESLQNLEALYHSNEITYNLSRNTNYTPFELARSAFDCAKWFHVAPWNQHGSWKSVSFYDLSRFNLDGDQPSFQEIFDDFTEALIAELNYNYSGARALFTQIRNEITLDTDLFSTGSMMVDLYGFVNKVLTYSNQFHYNDTLSYLCNQVLQWITPNGEGVILDEWHKPQYSGLYGFSICFPDSYDMYQGYLYPNFYEQLDISLESDWQQFISRMYPELNFNLNQFEFWEFQLNLVDPSVNLHVFLEQDPLKDPVHIGLNEHSDFGMGIELGLEGAEFFDDLQFGNSMIRIPAASLQEFQRKNNEVTFQVVINTTAAASATRPINLTVSHVKNQTITWQNNQISDFTIGQDFTCEVSTKEEITELEPVEEPATTTPPTTTPPTTTPITTTPIITNTSNFDSFITDFLGSSSVIYTTIGIFSFLIVIAVINYRKKKK